MAGERDALIAALMRAALPREPFDDAVMAGTVADFEKVTGALGPAARGLVRLSLWLTSRRPPTWWTNRPLTLRRIALLARDLVIVAYYEQPAVRDRLGYRPDPWIAQVAERRRERWAGDIDAHQRLVITPSPLRNGGARRPAGTIRPAADLATDAVFDAVVVGSGAGGAVVAAELAEAGLSVAVLEEGDHHPTEDFTAHTLDMLRQLYREAGAATTLGTAPVQFSEGRCVGGSTVVNGGMAFRAPPRVLAHWGRAAAMPGFGIDREYERVERFLSVGPPEPHSIGRDQQLLKLGADRLGWRTIECARAQVHCGGCNVCVWGCPTGAKQSALVSYLPRARHFGATIWTGARVDRVVLEGKRAVGVSGRANGRPFVVRATRVIIAAGAVQTPALLQRSRICTPSRQVGRNLTLHPGAGLAAVFDEPVNGWTGAHESYQIRELPKFVLAVAVAPPT